MSVLSRIPAMAPVNRQTAVVTSGGEHWQPSNLKLPPDYVRSETPLPTRPWPVHSFGQDNLTGRIVGRLTVIGLSIDVKKTRAKGSRWVVRCACGAFEHRTTRMLRQSDPKTAMCSHCDYHQQMIEGKKP